MSFRGEHAHATIDSVRNWLEKGDYEPYDYRKYPSIGPNTFVQSERQIRYADCMLLLIGDGGVGEDTVWQGPLGKDDGKNPTQREIRDALLRNGLKSDQPPPDVLEELSFPVILVFLPSAEKNSLFRGVPLCLRNQTRVDLREGEEVGKMSLLRLLDSWLRPEETFQPKPGLGEKPVERPQPPDDRMRGALTAREFRYINGRIADWVMGRFSAADAPAASLTDPRKALAYDPKRFVEVSVREISEIPPQEDTAQDDPPKPVFDWLVGTQSNFIILEGAAGSGKTITLSAIACAWAAFAYSDFANTARGIGHPADMFSKRLAQLGDAETLWRVPLALSCSDAAEHMAGADNSERARSLLRWIAGPDVLNGAGPDALAERITRTRYGLLLNGLDEIADPQIASRLLGTLDALSKDIGPNLKIIVSKRAGFVTHTFGASVIRIAPLGRAQIEQFLRQFAESTVPPNASRAARARHVNEFPLKLQRSIAVALTVEGASGPCQYPFFLNAACYLAAEGTTPQNTLFSFCHNVVSKLAADMETEHYPGVPWREILEHVGFEAIRATSQGLPIDTAGSILEGHVAREMRPLSAELLDHLCSRSELLMREGIGNRITLLHDLYGEYLAGAHVARHYASKPGLLLERLNVPKARLHAVASFVPAALVHAGDRAASWQFIDMLLSQAEIRRDDDRHILLAQLGFMALAHNRGGKLLPRRADMLRRARALYCALSRQVSLAARAQWLGLLAAATVEKSSEEGADEAGADLSHHLDDLLGGAEWVSVGDMPDNAAGGRIVGVARTPVLVGEFAEFETAFDNGTDPEHGDLWDHAPEGDRLLHDDSASYTVQTAWASQLPAVSAPVTGVTGYEAVAYCRWLTMRRHADGTLPRHDIIRLPTPREWEIVAKAGEPNRRYPWGDLELQEGETAQGNWFRAATDLDGPSPAGLFPAPACLPGLYDFGSNVQNWAAPEDVPWPPHFTRGPARWRVLGGSWACDRPNFQIHRKATIQPPRFRGRLTGFRVVRARV